MAAVASNVIPDPNPRANGTVWCRRKPLSYTVASNSRLLRNKFLGKPLFASVNNTQGGRSVSARASDFKSIDASSHSFDVVVVGAGIIGLTIARQFLLESDLSVAVVDAAVPCSGATGAGQGYVWMVHKTPESDKWELAMRSHELWELLADDIQRQCMNPLEILGWKKTGSLLIGRTADESVMLKRRVDQLSEAGLKAQFLHSSDLLSKEPALMVAGEGGAAFLPDDCQLDAHRTVAFVEKVNRHFTPEGRYAEFYFEPVISLLRTSSGEIEGIRTPKNILYSKKAVVIAAGCWSGSLMHDLIRDSDIELDVPVKPRKGHLLVVKDFNFFRLNHGLMEVGYADHQSATLQSSVSASGSVNASTSSVSMTATMDSWGNLVLGSSRQFVGFGTDIDESIIDRIWHRAGEFFPTLRELSLRDFIERKEIRVGLRPYMPDGKPMIGQVPGLPNLFLAAGHEGEGLALALGTAEMVADMVLGNPGKVDNAPFALQR
ncbi:uncharacterized protein LOC127786865 [Diospyros lotus]|uniref:uncharacterized protein LOC127786865 n=1 Tax=Diospyros lotus TaxID=55363 RepID=UPI00224D8ACD|nr:uncharacterized protein LOC127786865 [Diospyros lotus]